MAELEPRSAALLLMDFQNAIIGMAGDQGPPLLERAQRARQAARAAGMAVMHVRVAFADTDYAAISPRNKSFAALGSSRFMTDGTAPAAIHDALAPIADEEIFTKHRVGALSTTNLDARLKACGIDTLVLAGIATSGVVLSTLRDRHAGLSERRRRAGLVAFPPGAGDRDPALWRHRRRVGRCAGEDAADRDYRLFVLSDCCADMDAEVHRVLLEKVFPRQADVIDLAQLEAVTQRRSAG